ncbi:lipopolysaccharide biosynthesis protein [Novosphingobium colocasiae]
MQAGVLTARLRTLAAGNGVMARLMRGIIGSGGVWVLRLAMTLGMSFLLGHLLGPTEYGRYAYLVASVTLFAPLCSLGYDMLAAREYAAARAGDDQAGEAALARTLPAAVWKNAALVMLVFIPATAAYNAWRGQPWGDDRSARSARHRAHRPVAAGAGIAARPRPGIAGPALSTDPASVAQPCAVRGRADRAAAQRRSRDHHLRRRPRARLPAGPARGDPGRQQA